MLLIFIVCLNQSAGKGSLSTTSGFCDGGAADSSCCASERRCELTPAKLLQRSVTAALALQRLKSQRTVFFDALLRLVIDIHNTKAL